MCNVQSRQKRQPVSPRPRRSRDAACCARQSWKSNFIFRQNRQPSSVPLDLAGPFPCLPFALLVIQVPLSGKNGNWEYAHPGKRAQPRRDIQRAPDLQCDFRQKRQPPATPKSHYWQNRQPSFITQWPSPAESATGTTRWAGGIQATSCDHRSPRHLSLASASGVVSPLPMERGWGEVTRNRNHLQARAARYNKRYRLRRRSGGFASPILPPRDRERPAPRMRKGYTRR